MYDPMLDLEARRLSVMYALEATPNLAPAELVSDAEVIYDFLSGGDDL